MSIEPAEKVLNSIAKVPSGLTLAQLSRCTGELAATYYNSSRSKAGAPGSSTDLLVICGRNFPK
jgi:hypothetical protein